MTPHHPLRPHVCVEGIDGSGKTTLRNGMQELLSRRELPTIFTGRCSWATPAATRLMLEAQAGPQARRSLQTLDAFLQDAIDHETRFICPASAKALVLQDRSWLSSVTFHLAFSDLSADTIFAAVEQYPLTLPSLVVLLEIDPAVAAVRCESRGLRVKWWETAESLEAQRTAWRHLKGWLEGMGVEILFLSEPKETEHLAPSAVQAVRERGLTAQLDTGMLTHERTFDLYDRATDGRTVWLVEQTTDTGQTSTDHRTPSLRVRDAGLAWCWDYAPELAGDDVDIVASGARMAFSRLVASDEAATRRCMAGDVFSQSSRAYSSSLEARLSGTEGDYDLRRSLEEALVAVTQWPRAANLLACRLPGSGFESAFWRHDTQPITIDLAASGYQVTIPAIAPTLATSRAQDGCANQVDGTQP